MPSNPSPLDQASNVSTTTDLSWTGGDPDMGDTVTYDVYFGKSDPPVTPVSQDQSATTYDPGTLTAGTPYYWKIVAEDNHNTVSEGPVWTFNTAPLACNNLPDAAAYGKITGGDQTHVNQVDYCFSGRGDDVSILYEVWDADAEDEIEILINGQSAGFAPVTADESWGSQVFTVLPDDAVNDGTDNWLVFKNTNNPPQEEGWGVRNVSIASDSLPGQATLVSPISGVTIEDGTPVYIWDAVAASNWYHLWVEDSLGEDVVLQWYKASEVTSGDQASCNPAISLSAGAYTWQIRTYSDAGYGPWSDEESFIVHAAAPPGPGYSCFPDRHHLFHHPHLHLGRGRDRNLVSALGRGFLTDRCCNPVVYGRGSNKRITLLGPPHQPSGNPGGG